MKHKTYLKAIVAAVLMVTSVCSCGKDDINVNVNSKDEVKSGNVANTSGTSSGIVQPLDDAGSVEIPI